MDVDPPSSQSEPAPAELRPRRRLYSAPRRFDLATMLVVTTAYAIFLGGLLAVGATPMLTVILVGLVTLLGVAQAVLFGGREPRRASMLIGAPICALLLCISVFSGPQQYISLPFVLFATGVGALEGAVLGYFAGVLVGGVFLVADVLRRRF